MATYSSNPTSAYSLEDAIIIVAKNNYYGTDMQQMLAQVIHRAVDEIPEEMAHTCSYRLWNKDRCISINMMNYLLFRAPAYTDRGGKPQYGFFLIYPANTRGQTLLPGVGVDTREIFKFAYFECINVGLYLNEVASLSEPHWSLYKQACRMAASARRSREWPSNIIV